MEIRELDELREWEHNPRMISEKALRGLGHSLDEFGDLSGIVFNARLKALVCGHQRLKALREKYNGELKIESSTIITPKGEQFPIRIVDWDETKHAAANIAANNQRIAGDFTEGLAPLLDELKIDFPELSLDLNFDELRADYPKFFEKEIIEDEVPPVPQEATTKMGDLYELGRHRLLCGDSTKKEDVERLMDGKKPELMITDPPYGVEYDPAWRQRLARKGLLSYAPRRTGKIPNDNNLDWLEAFRLSPSKIVYCWHAGVHASRIQDQLEQVGFEIRNQIIWTKSNFAISRGHYHWRHEPCWYGVKKGQDANWIGDRTQTTLWEVNFDKNVGGGHPTQKPLECMMIPMQNHSGDVYDPFVGSGTTLIAAEQIGRICYGMEIEPLYVDVCVQRWVNFTKRTRIKRNGREIEWQIQTP